MSGSGGGVSPLNIFLDKKSIILFTPLNTFKDKKGLYI